MMVQVDSSNGMNKHPPATEYLAVVEPEAGGWSAYAPDIHGCTATGSTRLEAERNIREALASCLAGMRARGEPIPVPGRRTALIEVEVPTKDPASERSGREAR
jgi:predicted RNase H-like HicB family nuclease